MHQVVLRYILVALIVGAILKYTGLNLDDQTLVTYVLAATAIVYLLNRAMGGGLEGMEDVSAVAQPPRPEGQCSRPHRFPKLTQLDEDEANTFIRFDNDAATNPLLQHGQFAYDLRGFPPRSEEEPVISLNELPAQICNSKAADYVEQHNHVRWTPHTHVGKARNYLTWQRYY